MFEAPEPINPRPPARRQREGWVYPIYIPFALLGVALIGWLLKWDIHTLVPATKDAQKEAATVNGKYAATFERLKMKPLRPAAVGSQKVLTALSDIDSTPCDRTVIFRLSEGLLEAGEKRAAAESLLGFAGACPNSEGELFGGGRVLFTMGEYAAALPVFDKLVAMKPDGGQYYFTRGQVQSYLGKNLDAISDFSSAMALVDNQADVSSKVFTDLATAYSGIGRHCEAMSTIQAFVFADAFKRDIAATRKLISDYAQKGKCDNGYAKGKEVVPKTDRGVILAKVSINGVPGNFVIDTGASLVSVDAKFAQKAQLVADRANGIRLHTANGAVGAALTTAKSVQLGSVRADSVAVAIVDSPLGPSIDGLLGMSFLARFDIALRDRDVTIQGRSTESAK